MKPFFRLDIPELTEGVKNISDSIAAVGEQPLEIMKGAGIIGVTLPKHTENKNFASIWELKKKFFFLDTHFLKFTLTPGFSTLVHIDGYDGLPRIGKRTASLNIPIRGCNNSAPTEFYSNPESDFYFNSLYGVRVIKPDVELQKSDEYFLDDKFPVLMNPQVPHRVNNSNNPETRTTVSWTINVELGLTWEETVHVLSKYIKR